MADNNKELVQQNYQLAVTDPSAIAAAESAKARIQAAYIMAMNRPRSADDARTRILEACRRPEFASRVEYAKPVGGQKIKGPSIRFAETALRLWGNIDSDISVIYDDAEFRRINVRVTDLETNSTFSKQLNIRKTVERKNTTGRDGLVLGQRLNSRGETVYIVQSTDDELMNKENALISKALRNEGLRLIPSDIVDEALAAARATLSNADAQDPAAAKKRVLDAFASIGVRPKELEKYLKHSVDVLSPAELVELRAIHSAIKEGDAAWADYISVSDDEQKAPAQQKLPAFQDDKATEGTNGATEKLKAETSAAGAAANTGKEPVAAPGPVSDLDTVNATLKTLLKTDTPRAKAALIKAGMKPRTDAFTSIDESVKFFKAYETLKK